MTPTPEDIALAEEMDEYMSIDLDLTARLIAAHTAPLRERIKELERFATPLVSTTANATSQVINHESVGTVLGEKLRRQHQEMRELAEIGRLYLAYYHDLHTLEGEAAQALYVLHQSADAYLAKKTKP